MKNLLACLLAVIAGTFGISFIDNEARELINANSQKIEEIYSELQEIQYCEHSCKNYDYLEEQYNELKFNYEELSLICEKNQSKEYKIGDIIEIPVYYNSEKIDTLKCFIKILEIDQTLIKGKYKVAISFSGYFYTKNLGTNVSSSYIVGVKAEFSAGSE